MEFTDRTRKKKNNGKTRLCLDFRALNAVTVKDAYPMPNIDGINGRLDVTRYISSIGRKGAFWQIPLDDQAIWSLQRGTSNV